MQPTPQQTAVLLALPTNCPNPTAPVAQLILDGTLNVESVDGMAATLAGRVTIKKGDTLEQVTALFRELLLADGNTLFSGYRFYSILPFNPAQLYVMSSNLELMIEDLSFNNEIGNAQDWAMIKQNLHQAWPEGNYAQD